MAYRSQRHRQWLGEGDAIAVTTSNVQEYFPIDRLKKLFAGRLPEATTEVRIVRIGDYDAIPCIGKHVKSTKEIGQLKIISSDFNQGVLRIRYKLQ